jgi:peptide chain release factor 2
MRDFTQDIRDLQRRLSEAAVYLSVADNRERFAVLEHEVAEPGLWDDQDRAKRLNAEYANIKDDIGVFDKMSEEIENVEVLHELARDEDDASQELEIEAAVTSVTATFDQLELRSLFTGEHDDTDAQDFSEMLLRMYEKWCERRGFTITLNSVSEGAEAGIMSAEVTISGRYAYGLMSAERGTHRLVRISPFDNQGRRQTSFSAVQVWPLLEDVDFEIDDSDIEMQVFRASGAGGQHINKTSSAVRYIHHPTGLVATSQEERSQLQNRERAMGRLKSMIAAKVEEDRQAELDAIAGKQAQVGWGSQIRSYVMQPYQMVKDLRTEIETANVSGVLDGDIDFLIEGFLQLKRAQGEPES